MNDLLTYAVLANTISTLIMVFVFLYIYNENRHEHFLIWTIAWVVYFLFNVGAFAGTILRTAPEQSGLRLFWHGFTYASAGVSTVLMLWAGRSFAWGYRFHFSYLMLALLVLIWSSFITLSGLDGLWLSLPISAFMGAVFIWTGWVFCACQVKPRLKGTGVLTCAFMLWGSHKLVDPFLQSVETYLPYGYGFSTISGQLAAIGLIILILEESKSDVRLASKGLSNTYQELELTMNELKANIRELDETQKYLSSILDSSGDYAIISTDLHNNILLYNETAARMFGVTAAEAMGQPGTLVCYRDGKAESCLPDLQNRVDQEGHYECEMDLVRADDSRFSALVTATGVHSMVHKRIGMLIMIRDLTGQKELEQRVLAAEKLATIGRMASYVAHEIKNPLSSVNLNLELLADEIDEYDVPSTEEATELLGAIQEEIDRLTHNVDEYLRFARLPRLQLHVGDINLMLESLLQLVEPELAQAHIKIICDWADSIPPVRMDAEHLRSVFLNLVGNARDAMPEGGELRLSTRASGGMVAVAVEDTGNGIALDNLDSIFEPFYTTKASGTGLGLPHAQQIIHQHSGTIRCTSHEGQGTQFEVMLPMVDPDRGESGAQRTD